MLDRQFTALAPNRSCAADFTYVWTVQGWLYVAVVLDRYSRRTVGWSMRSQKTADLVTDAEDGAVATRQAPANLCVSPIAAANT